MGTSESHLMSHCQQPYNSFGSHLVIWRYFTIQTLSLYEHKHSLEPQTQCLIVSYLDIHQLHTFNHKFDKLQIEHSWCEATFKELKYESVGWFTLAAPWELTKTILYKKAEHYI